MTKQKTKEKESKISAYTTDGLWGLYQKGSIDKQDLYFLWQLTEKMSGEERPRLSSTTLEDIYGRGYVKMLRRLEEANVIEIDHSYSSELHYCKSFLVTEDFSGRYTKKLTYTSQQRYAGKSIEYFKSMTKLGRGVEPWVKHMARYNKLREFYWKDAMDELEQIKDTLTDDQYNSAICEIVRQKKRDKNGHLCGKYLKRAINGRVHYNISNMSNRMLKHYFRPSERMVQLDCANSQPLLIANIIDKHLMERGNNSANEWVRICQDGRFYWKVSTEEGCLEIEAKQGAMVTFFCEKYKDSSVPTTKWLKRNFPDAYELLARWKTYDCPFEPDLKRKNNSRFAIAIQKIEANLWIDNICRRVYEKLGDDVEYQTKHDSIIICDDYAQDVIDIIKCEYMAILGLSPTIKKSYIHNEERKEEEIKDSVEIQQEGDGEESEGQAPGSIDGGCGGVDAKVQEPAGCATAYPEAFLRNSVHRRVHWTPGTLHKKSRGGRVNDGICIDEFNGGYLSKYKERTG